MVATLALGNSHLALDRKVSVAPRIPRFRGSLEAAASATDLEIESDPGIPDNTFAGYKSGALGTLVGVLGMLAETGKTGVVGVWAEGDTSVVKDTSAHSVASVTSLLSVPGSCCYEESIADG